MSSRPAETGKPAKFASQPLRRTHRENEPAHPDMPPSPVRTSGQVTRDDAQPVPSPVNAKAEDLAPETVEPGELLTIDQGLGVSDDQNSLKAHVRGPTLEVAGLDTI